MSSLSLLVTLIFAPLNYCTTVYYRSTITTSQTSSNGISISQNDGSVSNNRWNLDANWPQNNYDLVVTIPSSSYGFHPTQISTLNITIISPSQGSTSGDDFTIAFQQTGSNNYFNMLINWDSTSDHLIYPSCDRTGYSQTYASGDVNAKVQSNPTNNWGWNEIYYVASDEGWGNWLTNSGSFKTTQSPITFTLENHPSPDNYLLFTYQSGSESGTTCGYNGAMNANTEMKIYIAANRYYNNWPYYDTIDISEIHITYSYDLTAAPTKTPSTHPSKTPTNQPSVQPSKSPTNEPTVSPTTLNPSITPTDSPSSTPTTSQPSTSPSLNPSKTPSVTPTFQPSISPTEDPSPSPTTAPTIAPTDKRLEFDDPTASPTMSPTKSPTISPVFNITGIEAVKDEESNHPFFNLFSLDVFRIIVGITLFLCCCCICCIMGYTICKKSKQINEKHQETYLKTVNRKKINKISVASNSPSVVTMSNLSSNSVKNRTTSTLINEYLKQQKTVVRADSMSDNDLDIIRDIAITAGAPNEDMNHGDIDNDTGTGSGGTLFSLIFLYIICRLVTMIR